MRGCEYSVTCGCSFTQSQKLSHYAQLQTIFHAFERGHGCSLPQELKSAWKSSQNTNIWKQKSARVQIFLLPPATLHNHLVNSLRQQLKWLLEPPKTMSNLFHMPKDKIYLAHETGFNSYKCQRLTVSLTLLFQSMEVGQDGVPGRNVQSAVEVEPGLDPDLV